MRAPVLRWAWLAVLAVGGCGGDKPKPAPGWSLRSAATAHLRALGAHRRPQPQHARGGHAGLRRVGRLRRRPAARRRLPRARSRTSRSPSSATAPRRGPQAGGKRIPVLTLRYSGPGRATAPVALVGLACRPAELRRRARPDRDRRARALHVPRQGAQRGGGGRERARGRRPRAATLPSGGSLIRPGLDIPAVAAGAGGAEAARAARELVVDTVAENRRTRNVIAERPGAGAARGDGRRPPRLRARGAGHQRQRQRRGGHARAGRAPARPARACASAFWGAEELGLYGSRRYVDSLSAAERRRITGYVNLDMVGSPNAVRYVYGAGRVRDALEQGAARAQAALRDDQHRRELRPRAVRGRRASPPAGCTRARRSARPRARRACSAAAPAGRSTPATTSAATCSTGSTATS